MEIAALRDLVLAYEERRDIADDLKTQLSEANKEKDLAEKAVITAILSVAEETGIDDLSVEVDGRKYSVRQKDYYSIPKENKDEAYQILRELGHGDLITERVDDRTLTSEMAEISAEYVKANPDEGEQFPPEYEPLLSLMKKYPKPSLGRVKSK